MSDCVLDIRLAELWACIFSKRSWQIQLRNMFTNFLWSELDGMDVDNIWFHQGGETCHAVAVIADEVFQVVISRRENRIGHQDRVI